MPNVMRTCIKSCQEMFHISRGELHTSPGSGSWLAQSWGEQNWVFEPWEWTPTADKAFTDLKKALCKAPVLGLPDFALSFVLETDASGIGMGAIFSQRNHPIAFFSKTFCLNLLQASTYVWELAAIMVAVKKWRQYLLGHHFTILTDHRSLKELMAQEIQTPEQQTYLVRLMGYNYTIQYPVGRRHFPENFWC